MSFFTLIFFQKGINFHMNNLWKFLFYYDCLYFKVINITNKCNCSH